MKKDIVISIEELMNPDIITSLYLYGEKSKPNENLMLNNSILTKKDIHVKIDKSDVERFMTTYGRFTNASQTQIVKDFFNLKLDSGVYSASDLAQIFGGGEGYTSHVYQHFYYPGNNLDDWTKRVYILNTQSYVVNPFAIFVVDEDGNKYIKNMTLLPNWDNFDFNSKRLEAQMGNNFVLKPNIDPFEIGNTVEIEFPSSDDLRHLYTNLHIYTKDDFEMDRKRHSDEKSIIYAKGTLALSMMDLIDKLWDSGTTKFVSQSGKTIIYGTNDSDSSVSTSSLKGKMQEYYNKNRSKGVIFVGGKGSDTIKGTNFDDILYSNDNSLSDDHSPDTLIGGGGNDAYYAGDGDTIIDDMSGDGEVYFLDNGKAIKLSGGSWDEDKNAYIDINHKDILYTISGESSSETLSVTNGSSTIKIKNFNKHLSKTSGKNYLDINLTDNLGKEVAIVIDTTGSMQDDIDAAKSSAKEIAKNIFKTDIKDSSTYSKISIVTFSDNSIKTIGSYSDYNSFQSGINSVFEQGGSREYHCKALIKGMSNFTPNNGLSKEIYLMTDESGDDNHRMDEVIKMANNFGISPTFYNLDEGKTCDNSVKINIISINNNQPHLKRLADETGGIYFQPNGIDELKDALFDASNIGASNSETIIGNDRDNIIEGKGGDDILKGGLGSDTYIFKGKFDKDTIIETNPNNIDKNRINLSSFSIKDAKFEVSKDDLVISIVDKRADTFISAIDKIKTSISNILNLNFSVEKIYSKDEISSQITIKDFFNKNEQKISFIEFSDYSLDELALNALSKSKVENIEILKDTKFTKPFKSSLVISNEDIVKASLKDDIVLTSKDSQTIISKSGNDTLISNGNNNTLIGGDGSDKYIITKDANNTIIKDKEFVNLIDGGDDTLIIKDTKKEDISFNYQGVFNKDLVINYKTIDGIDKTITIQNQSNTYSSIEKIKLDDGSFIDKNTINKVIEELNSYSSNNGISLNNIENFKNNPDIVQIYSSGWGK